MGYIIKCWIPVEAEDDQIYATFQEASADLEELKSMQPENVYEIEVEV